jgi:diadenosine tetraphosphate (Ap4A) HIT family hydrolase
MIMQLFSRLTFAKGMLISFLSTSSVTTRDDPLQPAMSGTKPALSSTTNRGPKESDYECNPTVFGKILRGEANCHRFDETVDALAFEDIHPRAPLHALVIPKRYIPTVFDLSQADLGLLEEMRSVALRVLQANQPEALRGGDYLLVFHVPPFNSVNHLHLHVLAPVSGMSWLYSGVKYNPRTRWCTDWDTVYERLSSDRPAVSYRRPKRLAFASTPCSSSAGRQQEVIAAREVF